MKMVKLIVRQADIVREFPQGFLLQVVDEASVIDVTEAAEGARYDYSSSGRRMRNGLGGIGQIKSIKRGGS